MSYVVKAATCVVLASLAVSDIRSRRLPNRSVLLVALSYLVDAALSRSGVPSVAVHLATAAGAFAVFALLFRFGWMAGGDVKLATAVFLWAGPNFALPVLFIVSLCGLVLGLTVLAIALIQRRRGRGDIAPTASLRKASVPYGVPLAIGGLAAVWVPALTTLST
ncbi:prepilin peptidase [Paraburkholderia mimosarum]|uniref:A24 family peptidase n=1 Tax=Paraburkholderia mimosarum TaxID=312026 RepID=UPI0039C3F343